MGWTRLSKPGEKYGPCKNIGCGHSDCNDTRGIAGCVCKICKKTIGYDTPFYNDDKLGYVHAICLMEASEEVGARASGGQH